MPTENQVTLSPLPTPSAFPWESTPYDVDVSVNPYNRDVFIRILIAHVETLSLKVQVLENSQPPPAPIPTVTTPKPKPAAKGGGSK